MYFCVHMRILLERGMRCENKYVILEDQLLTFQENTKIPANSV